MHESHGQRSLLENHRLALRLLTINSCVQRKHHALYTRTIMSSNMHITHLSQFKYGIPRWVCSCIVYKIIIIVSRSPCTMPPSMACARHVYTDYYSKSCDTYLEYIVL